jgi:hypothetical protein
MDLWTKIRDIPVVPMLTAMPISSDGDECKLPSAEGCRVHRVAVNTELVDRGPNAANQLAKLQGLLKDSPRQYILRQHPVNVPALSVVHYPNLDSQCLTCYDSSSKEEHRKGYNPGPKFSRSVAVKGNHIPAADYERRKFVGQRGQDFKYVLFLPSFNGLCCRIDHLISCL